MIKDKMKLEAICHYFYANGYTVVKSIGTGAFAEVFLIQNRNHLHSCRGQRIICSQGYQQVNS